MTNRRGWECRILIGNPATVQRSHPPPDEPMTDDPFPPGRLEREFGVPFAGRILDPARWTQTALKSYPADGRLNWIELFGRAAPVALDLGCGNGRWSIFSAVTRGGFDHFGLDTLPVVIRYAR